jgi:hypothetical protein
MSEILKINAHHMLAKDVVRGWQLINIIKKQWLNLSWTEEHKHYYDSKTISLE